VRADRLRSAGQASTRPWPARPPQPPRGAAPMPARTRWEDRPACAVSPGGPPRGHKSTDGLCSAPSRIAVPARPGADTPSGRRGRTAADPRPWATDSSSRSYSGGRYVAAHRGAIPPSVLGTRLQMAGPMPETPLR
jgi:hypothetical protein